ncbi:MAG TPA: hypothetical protein VGM39_03350 [Kofleriaceae bacterium]|jgi:hypothetical protein
MGVRGLLAAVLLTSWAACGGDDGGTGVSKDWKVITENQPASLLSVWADSDSNVFAVGGDGRDGNGPLVYHYDGAAWTKLDPGVLSIDLWWVYGFGDTVYMSGSGGTILQYRDGTFTPMQTPGTAIVFGMWGANANDVWAVGGNSGRDGFVWHYHGTAWTAETVPVDVGTNGTVWKVGGRAADDIWMSCANGVTLHWDGAAITETPLETESSLFSVGGNADRFITVGGAFDGEIYENEGTGWQSVLEHGQPALSGVTVHDDVSLAVGADGIVLRRGDDGTWTADPHATNEHLHAAFIDPSGGAWAVGGDFNAFPTKSGVLIHSGKDLEGAFP